MSCSPAEKQSYKALGFDDAQITAICGAETGKYNPLQTERSSKKPGVIKDFADLKKWNKDYKKLSLQGLILGLTKDGRAIAPTFYKQLQDYALAAEANSGASVSQIATLPDFTAAAENAYKLDPKTGTIRGTNFDETGSSAQSNAIELENLRFQHDQALAAQNDAAQAEAAKLAQENQLKRDKLSEAGALTRNFLDNQQKTRALIAELTGVDPIAATVASFGGVQRGTTPAQANMAANRAFVNQAIPTVDENAAVPQIQAVIDQLQQNGQPPVMPSIGFAQGGSVAGYGPRFGTNKTAILVGEAGTPPVAPGTEVQVSDPTTGQVEVIPLTTQGGLGMEEGGLTFGGIQYTPDSIRQGLAPLYGALGFSGYGPKVHRNEQGFSIEGTTQGGILRSGAEIAQALGYNPRLIRDSLTGAVYYKNPQGILQHITTPDVFRESGFQMGDIFNVPTNELGFLGQIGSDLSAPPPLIETPQERNQPLLAPPEAGNIPLPNLPALASALRGIRRYLDPNIWTLISSIYGRAGLGTPQTALETIQQTQRRFQPVGTATRAGTARLG